jgi:hypothetical protein
MMSRHVVTIKVKVSDVVGEEEKEKYELYDATVLSSQRERLYLIASSEFRNKIGTNLIEVELPNKNLITLERDDFDMAPQDTGVIGIRCSNPDPGTEFGFENLHPIDICEDAVIEMQTVYTYSHSSKERLLTPGSITYVNLSVNFVSFSLVLLDA